ncbi:mannose-6-phosphate isomerase, class I [Demequina aurantiaca]|uniref:mannose-6-phosphate isomerase, class I n=1 Tax=Demequina aurantiaca TaxID=676200 RepID=UPI003D33C704
MYLLNPSLKTYAWGRTDSIPELLGIPPKDTPVAEAWWGAHPASPATVACDSAQLGLDALIDRDADYALGPDVAREFQGRLPFLLKVLAIDAPLSIQVHPSMERAIVGFEAEEAQGVAATSPTRTFRDRSHKPEMIVALTAMTVLAGFRDLPGLRGDLHLLGKDGAALLKLVEDANSPAAAVTAYIRSVLALPRGAHVVTTLASLNSSADPSAQVRAACSALASHPGDPGALVALAMNVVYLAPGASCFVGDGTVHSYQSGVGVEIMANSDNVVRAGLTPKPINVPLLLDLMNAVPATAERPHCTTDGAVTMYSVPVTEFELASVRDGEWEAPAGPRIVLCLDGQTTVASANETRELACGEAVFVPFGDGEITVRARGHAVVASVPVLGGDSGTFGPAGG